MKSPDSGARDEKIYTRLTLQIGNQVAKIKYHCQNALHLLCTDSIEK